MSQALAKVDEQSVMASYTREQVDLIKSQCAPRATDDELRLYLYVAKQRGLDPLRRQIYCIHRKQWNSETRQEEWKMTIQTSIDGFRSIAERTGNYAPGDETWEDGGDGLPITATVTAKKLVAGAWHAVTAVAHFNEYAQVFEDRKAGTKKLGGQWQKMPHVMLAKCAEAKALRKGWPEQLGGLYTDEEMQQADSGARLDAIPQEQPRGEVVVQGEPTTSVRQLRPAKKDGEALPSAPLTGQDCAPLSIRVALPMLAHLGETRFCDMDDADLELICEHAPKARGVWAQRPNVSENALSKLMDMERIAGTLLDERHGVA